MLGIKFILEFFPIQLIYARVEGVEYVPFSDTTAA